MFGDSKLIINQFFALYEIKKLELLLYVDHAKKLLKWFDDVSLEHYLKKKIDRQML